MTLRTVTDQTRSYCRRGTWHLGETGTVATLGEGSWHSGRQCRPRRSWHGGSSLGWESCAEVRFEEGALDELRECQPQDGAWGTRGEAARAAAEGALLGLRRVDSGCAGGAGGGALRGGAGYGLGGVGWGGAGSGGGERARPPAPRGVPGEFTAGARSGPPTGVGGREGRSRPRAPSRRNVMFGPAARARREREEPGLGMSGWR